MTTSLTKTWDSWHLPVPHLPAGWQSTLAGLNAGLLWGSGTAKAPEAGRSRAVRLAQPRQMLKPDRPVWNAPDHWLL